MTRTHFTHFRLKNEILTGTHREPHIELSAAAFQ